MRYLALLRGINVGGNNVIKMADLKSCFEDMGFTDVVTYIQSGNVLFSAAKGSRAAVEKAVEAGLSRRFRYESRVALVSRQELRDTVKGAPKGFGMKPALYRYDVIFLKKPLTPAAAMKAVSVNPGVDAAWRGRHALYFSRLISKATSSRLPRVVQTPEYQHMTIRNWNTTTKLLALMGENP